MKVIITDPCTVGEAAKILDLSSRRVQQLEAAGVLTAVRTQSGVRILSRAQTQELRRVRDARRQR